MAKENVEEYLQQGIHGAKEIKPDERRRFLGTLRERVVVVLTKPEVRRNQIDPEFKELLADNKEAQLFLNGNMNYSVLSKYIQLADEQSIPYKIVTNKEYDSEFGLVLAFDYAINKEEIALSKNKKIPKVQPTEENKGFASMVKKIFRKS